jgi:hypothetical protein
MSKLDGWMKEVDKLVYRDTGLRALALEEIYDWEDAFRDDLSPEEALEDFYDCSQLARVLKYKHQDGLSKLRDSEPAG